MLVVSAGAARHACWSLVMRMRIGLKAKEHVADRTVGAAMVFVRRFATSDHTVRTGDIHPIGSIRP